MKVFLTTTCCLLLTCSALAQYFSGVVEYRTRIISKVKGLNTDSILSLQPGTSSVYKITAGFYKSTYFKGGKETYSYTYHGDTKRMYDAQPNKGYITYRDSRKANNVRIRSIIYKDSISKVAGHSCFMVERVYENYISKIFYAQDLKINPESFKDHATGDWYNQIKEVGGALSLGSINEYATHIEVDEVVRVSLLKLNQSDFDLPSGKLIVASAGALDEQAQFIPATKEVIQCYQDKSTAALQRISSIKHTSYIGFILKADGTITHAESYEEDEHELYKVALDVVEKCGLKFKPGILEGKAIDSWVYFPIEFSK